LNKQRAWSDPPQANAATKIAILQRHPVIFEQSPYAFKGPFGWSDKYGSNAPV